MIEACFWIYINASRFCDHFVHFYLAVIKGSVGGKRRWC